MPISILLLNLRQKDLELISFEIKGQQNYLDLLIRLGQKFDAWKKSRNGHSIRVWNLDI